MSVNLPWGLDKEGGVGQGHVHGIVGIGMGFEGRGLHEDGVVGQGTNRGIGWVIHKQGRPGKHWGDLNRYHEGPGRRGSSGGAELLWFGWLRPWTLPLAVNPAGGRGG